MNPIDNTEATIRKFEPMLNELNLPELQILNRMVVQRIRFYQKAKTLTAMSRFHVGDRVSWDGSDGIVRTGIITRLNQKTASVKVGYEEYWKVSPQLLGRG